MYPAFLAPDECRETRGKRRVEDCKLGIAHIAHFKLTERSGSSIARFAIPNSPRPS